jgi:4a-hydroxytetrahydrobiopterin dehydratase
MAVITSREFHEASGVADWRATAAGAAAYFDTRDFNAGAAFVAEIAKLADAANHHPDVDLRYRGVTVRVVTHSAGGLTQKDVELARQISGAADRLGIASDPSRLPPPTDPTTGGSPD